MTKALLVRDLVCSKDGWEESSEYIVPASDIREIMPMGENPCILQLGFTDGTQAHIRVVSLEYFLQTIEWSLV